jgi:hypothetical protein
MKTTCKLLLALLVLGTTAFTASAQLNSWSVNNENRADIRTDKAVARQSFPKDFVLFDLHLEPLRQQLFSIVGSNTASQSTIIVLPNANGQYEQFEVFEASNFDSALQAQFPEIRAYSGKGITDRYATLKLSISPQGIQTMIFRTEKDNEFIEPYSEDHTVYAVFRSQRVRGRLPWTCSTEDKQTAASLDAQLPASVPESNTGQLKTMRLAQSCNAEYSNFFGAFNSSQVALVLAAFNATLTRCNGCYEKDLALHLILIANTTAVIYYNPDTDPYTTMGQWNSQLQATLTANIGEANYDIGHMFGASGGGGNAGCIGCVCVNGSKGSGITSPADAIPMGDNFDIDYVAHEVGHQLGANHSFSHSLEGSGVNKEVGSGITIMGYAGITGQDVAPHSIDIFHEANIQQIQNNLANKTCPITTVMTANHTPVVAPVSNVIIPITTAFALTGSATDLDGDPLTYCWEQNDNATTSGANSVASPTKLTGPNWLSFSPTASPTRTFPRLSTILAGLAVTPPFPGGDAGANIEALSSVSRTLNFRLTARDNRPYVPSSTIGQTQFTDMTVTVTNTSGPFQVTSPNTNVSWAGGSSQTITWAVANTTLPPVSCANVKISLSTDGGQTFPTVLLASTPNDGSEAATIPVGASTTARVKVEAVGNVFFDISNTNFTITGPGATPTPSPDPTPTPTPTMSPGITPTPSPSPDPSPTSTASPTVTPSTPIPTPTPTIAPTATPTPTCVPGSQVFSATLNGAQEVPPSGSTAGGSGIVVLNQAQTMVTVNLSFAGLAAPATMAHIHAPGAPGVNAPIIIPLTGFPAATSGTYSNSFAITPTQVSQLQSGLAYLNIHNGTFANGEIRGQLALAPCPPIATPTPTTTPTPATPTPTATTSPSATPLTPTPSPTSTPAPTPTPTLTPSPTPTPTPSPPPAAQAVNLSTRMRVQTGENVGIGGFIISGTAPKHVLLRAIGPSITGLPGVLADPVLELHGPAGFAPVTNNNWQDDPAQAALILASGLAPTNNLESAIDATLNPGAYTGVVSGNGVTTGIGLIEVYDLSQSVLARLGNISTRALVGTGNDIVIAGFILGNNSGATRLVIRGIGGSLTAFGVANALANPTLELRNSSGALLAANDNWQDDPAQAAELAAAGLAPTNASESGIALTLGPGQYTALLAGQGNTTGVGVVEVYDRGP